MARWSVRQIFVFVLAVLVTADIGLSAVQAATAMPEVAKMSMMPGMSCKQCGGDMGGGKAMMCSPVCVSTLAAVPQMVSEPMTRVAVSFGEFDPMLTGRSLAPEPYPPRPFHFI
jgi:hypothetical protein